MPRVLGHLLISVNFGGDGNQTACKPGSVPPAKAGAAIIPLDRPLLDGSRDLPEPPGLRRPCRIAPARGPYSVLLLAGLAMPSPLLGPRCALTAPFHPCPGRNRGGLLSVALSLGSPPAGVTRRHVVVEPGLSSPAPRGRSDRPAVWFRLQQWPSARPASIRQSGEDQLVPGLALPVSPAGEDAFLLKIHPPEQGAGPRIAHGHHGL